MSGEEVQVVAAVIRRDGAVLLARRPPDERHGGQWEFPGGKIREGETRADAVRRELREELGVETLSVGETLHEIKDPGTPFLILFLPAEIEGDPLPLVHADLRWCHQEDLLGSVPLSC